MNRSEWLESLPKDQLIIMLKNTEYQLEIAEDKVEYFTGCRGFGECDGMDGACVDCSYNDYELWKKCHPFNTIFWPWHLEKVEERRAREAEKNYEPQLF